MKKYSSGSFVDAALRVYGSEADTISSFPASIITNGGNITPWSIYGNTSGSQSVGEKTANLFNYKVPYSAYLQADSSVVGSASELYAIVNYFDSSQVNQELTISIKANNTNQSRVYILAHIGAENYESTVVAQGNVGTMTITLTPTSTSDYWRLSYGSGGTQPIIYSEFMINSGGTASTYEPYGYKLPVVIGSTTTNIYMADVLRMSSGADPVYDIMSSTGVITRNVDTDGSPLPTPTTESFTAPTLATVAGSQSFTIDTTVKPSSVSLTYTGWHTHSDKQYSGGSWGQVTSNAKKKKGKKHIL